MYNIINIYLCITSWIYIYVQHHKYIFMYNITQILILHTSFQPQKVSLSWRFICALALSGTGWGCGGAASSSAGSSSSSSPSPSSPSPRSWSARSARSTWTRSSRILTAAAAVRERRRRRPGPSRPARRMGRRSRTHTVRVSRFVPKEKYFKRCLCSTYTCTQCCGKVMIFCSSGFGSDFGIVKVPVPDPDKTNNSFLTAKKLYKILPF